MTEHEMRPDCKEFRDEHKVFKEEMMKNPGGTIVCLQKKLTEMKDVLMEAINNRVKWQLMYPILFLIVVMFGASFNYTYGIDRDNASEHKELATKKEIAEIKINMKEGFEELKSEIRRLGVRSDKNISDLIDVLKNTR